MAGQTKTFGLRGVSEIKTYPVKSSATFKQGDFLIFTTTGLDIAAASAANVAATSQYVRIVGRALGNALDDGGVVRTHMEVQLANPETEFELPIYHATAASAIADPANQIGLGFELRNASGGSTYWGVDVSANTNKKIYIVDYNIEDYPLWPDGITAGTTQYPRVWARFISACVLVSGAR